MAHGRMTVTGNTRFPAEGDSLPLSLQLRRLVDVAGMERGLLGGGGRFDMPVNTDGAAMDNSQDTVPPARRQDILRPGHVDVPVDAVRQAGRTVRGGQVEHHFHPLDGPIHRRRIADIATGDLHAHPLRKSPHWAGSRARMRTVAPPFRRRRTRWLPAKPVPPVTSAFTPSIFPWSGTRHSYGIDLPGRQDRRIRIGPFDSFQLARNP